MGAREAIELYERGEPWFKIPGEEGFILEDLARLTYKRLRKGAFGNTYETGDKDLFAHNVVGHSFMEFLGITGLQVLMGAGELEKESDVSTYYNGLRKIYDKFVEINKVPEDVRELGWEEFIHD